MDKCYCGIDPGANGGIALQDKEGIRLYALADYPDVADLSDLFYEISATHPNIVAAIEEVHAIFGSSAKSTFNFGRNFGMLTALLCATKMPYVFVQPKDWQATVWCNSDKSYVMMGAKKKIDTKKTSLSAAKRLFPGIDFRRNNRCRKDNDGLVDAMLICEYAKRKNL